MKQSLKSILSMTILTAMIFTAACNGKPQNTEDTNVISGNPIVNETAKGKYQESDCPLPTGVTDIYAMSAQNDSSIKMLTNAGVFTSNDGGAAWNADASIDISAYMTGESSIVNAAISLSGEIALWVALSDSQYQLVYIGDTVVANDLAFPQEKVEGMSNMLLFLEYTAEGNLLAIDMTNSILIIDPVAAEIKKSISADSSYRYSAHSVGDFIIVQTSTGVDLYNMSGDLQETDPVITDTLNDPNPNTKTASGLFSPIAPDQDGRGFYSCNSKGIYHLTRGSSVVELLVNSDSNNLGNLNYAATDLVTADGTSFLVLLKDDDNQLYLKRYTFSADAEVRPSGELLIYSLYDNKSLRQTINQFNSNNSGIVAAYQVGIGEDSTMTEGDAIKSLNTDIMSGNGPDILIMDGMSVETLAGKNLLVDISEVIDSIAQSDGLFDNIAGAYSMDGNIYAVATRYMIPLVMGKTGNVQNIADLHSLKDEIGKLSQERTENSNIIGLYDEHLLEMLFDISAFAWINADGSLSETELTDFIQTAYDIQQIQMADMSREDINKVKADLEYSELSDLDLMLGFNLDLHSLALFRAKNLNDFTLWPMIRDQQDAEMKAANGQSTNTFIPVCIAGINAKSANVESAKEFIRQMLSEEFQAMVVDEGLPVNQKAYDTLSQRIVDAAISHGGDDVAGGEDGADIYRLEPEELVKEYGALKDLIQTLDTQAVTDQVIRTAVVQEGTRCLTGDISVDECVRNILQKVNLYLSE